MLELKQTIINVNSYTAYYDLLFYEKNNIIYLNNKPTDYPELPRIAIDNKLVINKNNVFYNVLKDNIPCIEYNNSKKIAYYLNSLCSFDNSKVIGGIISFDNKLKKIVYDNQGIYDLSKNEVVSKINIDREYSFVFNTDKIAFFQKEKFSIVAYSLTTPQTPQWQFDLSQFGTFQKREENLPYKVEKFIGIHQDRLYVALNDGMLLEIDIATGAVTYQWQNIKTTDRGFSYPVEPNTFTLDKQLGKLVSFYTADFITIDLASKKVNITPMDEELKKFDGRAFKPTSINYAIDETHIYTLVTLYAPEADFIKESVVAFNKQTKKIDWNFTDYQFGMAGGDTPKLAGNKLYLKVNITNLYIFEKTSNESI